MKHGNISIFIPHLGCPNDCAFCNQRHISGTVTAPNGQTVRNILSDAVKQKGNDRECEIAFFGGSFTAIDRIYMEELLKAAAEYAHHFSGIRISTRPDCINRDVLSLLKEYGVTDIELGVQSMVDSVLTANGRGHLSQDTVKASELIREYGFGLGHQMMTGLISDSDSGAFYTAERISQIKPDTVRIYPTLVIKDTRLEELYRQGKYTPQDLDSAVSLCARLITFFENKGIRVIRVGLHSDGIGNSFVAGPFHPAFGELCESRIYRDLADKTIGEMSHFEGIICVNPCEISKMVGQHRDNVKYLSDKYGVSVKVTFDKNLNRREITAK